jgi:Tol biopolymer transport system component
MNGLWTRRSWSECSGGWGRGASSVAGLLAALACSDPGVPDFSEAGLPGSDNEPVLPGGAAGTSGVAAVPITTPDAPVEGSGGSGNTSGGGGSIAEPPDDDPVEEAPVVPPALECRDRVASGGVCFCPSGAFGAPELVTGLAVPGSAFGPSLSSDGLTLFFSVIDGVNENGPAGPNENDEDIWLATRSTRSVAFTPAALVAGLDAGDTEEGTPFISVDALSLYFFSTRVDPSARGDRDLWVAKRVSAASAFDAPNVVEVVNSPQLDHLPWVSADNRQLFFVSDRPSPNGASNIWVASRASSSVAFDEPVELAGINTAAREEGFSLTSDGLTIVLSSNRTGSADLDLWMATRTDVTAAFSEPVNLVDLNSAAKDGDAMLSPDGLELFFSSERNGINQLFRAVRQCD